MRGGTRRGPNTGAAGGPRLELEALAPPLRIHVAPGEGRVPLLALGHRAPQLSPPAAAQLGLEIGRCRVWLAPQLPRLVDAEVRPPGRAPLHHQVHARPFALE
eukprot:29319-Prymnesium_polylepis.2